MQQLPPSAHNMAGASNNQLTAGLNAEIAIIGGGPAGACCALALRRRGAKRITLIEASGFDRFRIGESIPPECKSLMLKLGIWQAFLAEQHLPCYGSRSWWGDEHRGYNDSLLNPLGHGWHLDRVKFDRFLATQAQQAHVTLLTHHQFYGAVAAPGGGFRLKLRHNKRTHYLNADFVIDASGAKSLFAKLQNSGKQYSSPLLCSSGLYKINGDNHPLTGLTHLEAVVSGWWYAARLPQNLVMLSHTTDSRTFRTLNLKSHSCWNEELRRATQTHSLCEGLQAINIKPAIYSAQSFVLNNLVGSRWMAIGDAASCFDPITSQGIYKSMSDGISAASCVTDYIHNNDFRLLEEFQAMVKTRHQQYRNMRHYFYLQERRFKDHSFWQQMHDLPAVAHSAPPSLSHYPAQQRETAG